ncbi:MAG: alpha/beta fold hydrolase [Janthinobacterium lividum]
MRTILALHYWAGAGHEYNQLLPWLPAGLRLLAPDLPGYGQQLVPAGFDFSVASYADWVAAYVAEQQLDDYYLLGHSMGGKFALALAARQPLGLRGLLLLSPSPPTPEPIGPADRAASRAAWGQPEKAEKTFHKITNRPLPESVQLQVVADNLRTSQAAWEAWLDLSSKEDIAAQMPTINVPCSLLVGTDDRAIPAEAQEKQTRPLLPAGSAFGLVPGAGHLLPYEAPEEIANALHPLLTA